VNLVQAYDQVSSTLSLYVIIHIAPVVLHFSNGMYYFVADGANSLRQGRVRGCP
jgi:succinate dehydrogenase/fumarate reductase cytochrome b subunit